MSEQEKKLDGPGEPDWRDELGSLLVGTDLDLLPGSESAQFLSAMTSPRLMSVVEMTRLPPRLALEHLARTAPTSVHSTTPALTSIFSGFPWPTPSAVRSRA
jgi:hypothetical protein